MTIWLVAECTEEGCDTKSEAIEGDSIDRYSYHDAPTDAVAFQGWDDWFVDVDENIALCPEHIHLKAQRQWEAYEEAHKHIRPNQKPRPWRGSWEKSIAPYIKPEPVRNVDLSKPLTDPPKLMEVDYTKLRNM